ncbi:FAD-linked oxidase C-terminal domain-containing protein [Dichotomicrobium thermohalophilum]|uniref:Glycolate oxidase n=1 Tax=Dichotomicrobium thermohalophilum TaxID=933063 RepID=A0A397QAE8_9HYPH|nr:FAD-linked oxidase C-terminal domain-containing protein [Dichotomicrobium thermohalophilum]RIA56785.1 glycolate oxidase [Dichotomicrobium thermohalophilum]
MSGIQLPEPDTGVLDRRDALVAGLQRVSPNVVTDPIGLEVFEADALTAYRNVPLAVVLPTSTEEVSRVLRFCHENDLNVLPRGAGTSLSGGALPMKDTVVVGISKMNQVLDINLDDRVARVQTGITNLGISNAVSELGFFYAPDPSSQLACTLAGNIAMNSGGAHCLKYGVTTNNILGMTVVMMDGEIVEFGGDFLDPHGYDFLGLMTGSEGQFGIVTEATVRILPKAEGERPMLMGFNSAEDAGGCVAAIIGAGIVPVALEYMDRPAIKICEDFAGAGYPLDVEALLIVEVEGSEEEIADLFGRIREIAKDFNPTEMREAQSAEEAAAIWRGRKSAFGAMGRISDYMCMDGVIPLSTLPKALSEVSRICQHYGLGVANIFHAGDGNLHPLIMFNANDPDEKDRAERCGGDILEACVELGGCLTGEHGVGIEKRDLMTTQYNRTDLEQQIRVKTVFDPDWRLNRGKVFPLDMQPGNGSPHA